MQSRLISILAVILLLTGCSTPLSRQHGRSIHWVDFILFDGITYIARHTGGGRPLAKADLGSQFATVKFKLSDKVGNAGYRAKNGDAAFLERGTPVYTVQGYKPEFRLAAARDGQIVLFEADTNPRANWGADLLDISGKVRRIGINSVQDGTTELAAIQDRQQLATLIDLVLQAPVGQPPVTDTGRAYFIAFHLDDGTIVTRMYNLASGELHRGIMLPHAFAIAVEQALAVPEPTITPTR